MHTHCVHLSTYLFKQLGNYRETVASNSKQLLKEKYFVSLVQSPFLLISLPTTLTVAVKPPKHNFAPFPFEVPFAKIYQKSRCSGGPHLSVRQTDGSTWHGIPNRPLNRLPLLTSTLGLQRIFWEHLKTSWNDQFRSKLAAYFPHTQVPATLSHFRWNEFRFKPNFILRFLPKMTTNFLTVKTIPWTRPAKMDLIFFRNYFLFSIFFLIKYLFELG